jgi:RNA polymerase sigma factor (sigma-70 family)
LPSAAGLQADENSRFGFRPGADYLSPMLDDAELLRRYATASDEDAFHTLVQRRFGLVYAIALRQVGGDAHLARDVAQHVFVALARQATALSHRTVISGWLYRAARYTAIDIVRADRRRRRREEEAHRMQEFTSDPDSSAASPDWRALRPVLDETLSELNDSDRDAVMLRIFEERSFAEIGALFRVTEDAARMRVDRALDKLRHRLRRRGLTSTTAALSVILAEQALAAPPAGLATSIASSALASAKLAAGASAIGSAAFLMSTTKTFVATGIVVIAALVIGVQQARLATSRTETAATLQQEIDSLKNKAATLAAPTSVPQPPAVRADPSAPPPSTSASPALDAQAKAFLQSYEARQRLRATSPEFQQLSIRAVRANTRLNYAPLLHASNLSADQIAAFEDLLVDQAWNSLDVTGARLSLGLRRDDPVLQQQMKRDDAAFEAKLRERLGDDFTEQYLRFEATAPLRELTSVLASNLYHTATPLTTAQAKQITQVVDRYLPNLENLDQRWRTHPRIAESILADSRALLAPAQHAALAAQFDNQHWAVESVWKLNQPSPPAP